MKMANPLIRSSEISSKNVNKALLLSCYHLSNCDSTTENRVRRKAPTAFGQEPMLITKKDSSMNYELPDRGIILKSPYKVFLTRGLH